MTTTAKNLQIPKTHLPYNLFHLGRRCLAVSCCVLATAGLANGSVLTAQNGSEKIESVPVATSATTDKGAKLAFLGAGLRSKKVVFVNVKVYVAELFAADAAKFKKNDEALNSLVQAQPVAIQMHFLRDVDAAKVQSSFREALENNHVDLNRPEIQKLLESVKTGGEAKSGKALTVVGIKNADGTESITYEDANQKVTTVTGSAGFIKDIFSMWLGQPSDEGVARLKASLLK